MGLDQSLYSQGAFPHRLNRLSNMGRKWNFHPPSSYYDVQGMKPEDQIEFYAFYEKNKRKAFDFDQEIITYCHQDVLILAEGILKFQELFMEITTHPERAVYGINPFKHSFTLAGAVSRTFRQIYLEPETIALIPSQGPQPQRKQSQAGLRWLKYMNEKHRYDPAIQHTRNGGEVRIMGFFVDGYREAQAPDGSIEKHVYEFLGKHPPLLTYI